MHIERTTVKSIECLGEVDDYVYDLSIEDQDPFFFANDILVHNTDSSYFSVWPIIKDDVAAGTIPWTKETCIELYDGIADNLNDSFPEFMYEAFHCPRENGALIKGGRELVAEKGLFITKKRYAVLIFDLEGKRCDVLGEPGKLKAMGLDLKRSDTPKDVQKFLSEILLDTLTGVDKTAIIEKIKNFKMEFAKKPSWEKGVPKRVNNLSKFTAMVNSGSKGTVPGHVRASINWNNLKRLHNDQHSMSIVDGMKTIVCRLKDNPMGYHSVAIPIDQKQLPQWYKDLPFDDDEMEKIIVDQKVDNLMGVLEWDITNLSDTKSTFQSLFSFG
ncbi:Intein C-terminal splicing region [uncultured Caudovirales phage]|uniref:Intein C-terminal splicing region n=1 Tax=uncultured Caudovirales phage TaxID=2100421 RepID=A0A6J5LF05_9CAUD|nr:Intein C-terminal splicing region [uncultured Caudovirales phage]